MGARILIPDAIVVILLHEPFFLLSFITFLNYTSTVRIY